MNKNAIKDNKIADIELCLDDFNPVYIAEYIAVNFKKRRLELNLTQQILSTRSGVSLGSIKRFEKTSEISLKHLLMTAVVLQVTEDFYSLFSKKQYSSISEIENTYKTKIRQRARKNDKTD